MAADVFVRVGCCPDYNAAYGQLLGQVPKVRVRKHRVNEKPVGHYAARPLDYSLISDYNEAAFIARPSGASGKRSDALTADKSKTGLMRRLETR